MPPKHCPWPRQGKKDIYGLKMFTAKGERGGGDELDQLYLFPMTEAQERGGVPFSPLHTMCSISSLYRSGVPAMKHLSPSSETPLCILLSDAGLDISKMQVTLTS